MNYKNAYSYLNTITLILFAFIFLLYLLIPRIKILRPLYLIPMTLCFLANVVFFIIFGITNRNDPNNHFKKVYNTVIISIILLLFTISIVLEFIKENSTFLKKVIKPFSDFFGYIFVEAGINKILNKKLEDINYDASSKYKVYNNWSLLVNKLKRRITSKELITLDVKKINFSDDKDSKNFLFFSENEQNQKNEFINLLNIKEDIGYIIWMIIIIILLYYIK